MSKIREEDKVVIRTALAIETHKKIIEKGNEKRDLEHKIKSIEKEIEELKVELKQILG